MCVFFFFFGGVEEASQKKREWFGCFLGFEEMLFFQNEVTFSDD